MQSIVGALVGLMVVATLLIGCGGSGGNYPPEPIIDPNGNRWLCLLDADNTPFAVNTSTGYRAPAEEVDPDSDEEARWLDRCRNADTILPDGDNRPATTSSDAREVSATTLTRAYEENNVAAQRNYGDQRYRITGLVNDAGVDLSGDTIVRLQGHRESRGIPWVIECIMRDGAGAAAATLRAGDTASLEGVVHGQWVGYNVRVRDCELR